MQKIQSIFREVQDGFSEADSLTELFRKLNEYDTDFRSVAYEAASMCIALADLKDGNELTHWNKFLSGSGDTHNTQIHVGLGWALAQQSVMVESYLPSLEPLMRYRVLDGYGYYDGFFRKRKSLMARQQPDFHDAVASAAYDQGLGRSVWYLSNGQIEEAQKMLEGFSPERQKDMWRGLGIGVTYVGGLDETYLNQIISTARKHKPQFATGAALSVISRYIAGSVTEESISFCKAICHMDINSLWVKNESIRVEMDLNDPLAYESWIHQLETLFGD